MLTSFNSKGNGHIEIKTFAEHLQDRNEKSHISTFISTNRRKADHGNLRKHSK